MAKKSKLVRLEESVYQDLCRLRDEIHSSHADGRFTLPDSQVERTSLSYVVKLLVERERGHRRRGTRQFR